MIEMISRFQIHGSEESQIGALQLLINQAVIRMNVDFSLPPELFSANIFTTGSGSKSTFGFGSMS